MRATSQRIPGEGPIDEDDSRWNHVTVIIPALNEEQSLPLVLADLPNVGQVIVAVNGSTDATVCDFSKYRFRNESESDTARSAAR